MIFKFRDIVRIDRNVFAQDRRAFDHRPDTVIRNALGIIRARGNHQCRARILIDDKPEHVVHRLGLADLRCRHDRDLIDIRVGKRVHDPLEIRRTAGLPLPGLS